MMAFATHFQNFQSYRISKSLCLKYATDNTSQTALFLLLNLIDTVAGNTGAEGQQVHAKLVEGTVNSQWNVVDNTRLEARVNVVQHECSKGCVDDGGGGACERRTNQRQQTNSNDSLAGPVERAMRLQWLRWNIGLVDVTGNTSGRLGDGG